MRKQTESGGLRHIRRLGHRLQKAKSRFSAPLNFPELRPPDPNDYVSATTQVPDKHGDHLRLFSLNVAHAQAQTPVKPYIRRRTAQRNLGDIAAALRTLTPDIVALQEVDGPSTWSGNFDHVESLARQAGLSDHYRGDHNAFGFGRYRYSAGTALLARQPLLDPSSHRFGASWHDTKGFVVASVVVPAWGDLSIDVVSVHLDPLVPAIRRKQILHMVDTLARRPVQDQRPLVVLGDLNCCWHYEPRSMELLVEKLSLRAHEPESWVPTYPARRPRRRIDWILVSPELDFSGYHTVQVPLSDHLFVVADLARQEAA